MINTISKRIRVLVLHPWVLKNKAEILGLIKQQESYRNHVVMSLYKTRMGWQSINKALLAMGLKTVKGYYMERNGNPRLFFEWPDEERRKTLPHRVIAIAQPSDK